MKQCIILSFPCLPLHTSSLRSSLIQWYSLSDQSSVRTLTLLSSSLLLRGSLHYFDSLFCEINHISTETVTITFVSDHCKKPVGLDFTWFLSLHLLGLFCQKSLNKTVRCRNCETTSLGTSVLLK